MSHRSVILVLVPAKGGFGDTEPFSFPFDAGGFTAEYTAGSTRPGWLEAVGQALWRAAFSGLLGVAADFAVAFYGQVLEGQPLGEAMRAARKITAEQHPADPSWASFVLCGDPSFSLAPARMIPGAESVNVNEAPSRGSY